MKIGIVSFAHLHAESYAAALLSLPQAEFVGITDPDPRRGADAVERHGVPFFAETAHFYAGGVEAVVICSENARHRRDVEEAAAHGCAILCEKPLAITAEDAKRMVEICAAKGVLLMTAFPMRYAAPVVHSRNKFLGGELGKVGCVNSRNQGQNPKGHRGWFVEKELSGGGALTDHIVHLADIFRWIFQEEVVEVYARSNRIIGAEEVEVETGGLVMLTMQSGRFISLDCSWSRPAGYPAWGGLAYEFIGEKGILKVDAFRQNNRFYGESAGKNHWTYWGSDADRLMLINFLAAAEGKEEPRVTGMDGLRAVEIVEAAYRSDRTGNPEKI